MSKANSLLRGMRRQKQHSSGSDRLVLKTQAESAMEAVMLCYNLAVVETLIQDFGFDKDQIRKFQDISEVKYKIKRVELGNSFTP